MFTVVYLPRSNIVYITYLKPYLAKHFYLKTNHPLLFIVLVFNI